LYTNYYECGFNCLLFSSDGTGDFAIGLGLLGDVGGDFGDTGETGLRAEGLGVSGDAGGVFGDVGRETGFRRGRMGIVGDTGAGLGGAGVTFLRTELGSLGISSLNDC